MSSSLARVNRGVARSGTSRRLIRAVSAEVDEAQGRAVVRAARVEGEAFVAHMGLRCTETLTSHELQAAEMYPEAAYRFKAIVDGYTALVVNELREMGYE